jgi:hypothetical protein
LSITWYGSLCRGRSLLGILRNTTRGDDIDWKHNPFDVDSLEGSEETPEQLMSQITFEGSPQLQTKLKALVLEFIDVFATKVRREPVAVEPMKIVIDEDKWRLPCNRAPPRKHSEEKQKSKLIHSWKSE